MRQYIILLLLSSILTLFNISCKNNPTEPVLPEAGRRDYVWKADTLKIPLTTLTRIWGSSAENVWAIGIGGGLDKSIWHYNGKQWMTDGISRPIAPSAVWGFSSNNVWIAGQDRIWHYDGSKWSEHTKFSVPGYQYVGIENLWGDSPDNIYAVGHKTNSHEIFKPLMLHFDGNAWTIVKTPEINCSFIRINRSLKQSIKYYIKGYSFNNSGDSCKTFEFDGKNFKEIYSSYLNSGSMAETFLMSGDLYSQIGRDLYQFNQGTWDHFYTIKKDYYTIPPVGRNSRDIFITMEDGICHYNGDDLVYVYKFQSHNISQTGHVIFEKDVFFMTTDVATDANIIFRGKLK